MSTIAYHDVLDRAQRLAPADQLRLLEELTAFLRCQVAAKKQHSILELKGLGKEIWHGKDAQEYMTKERTS